MWRDGLKELFFTWNALIVGAVAIAVIQMLGKHLGVAFSFVIERWFLAKLNYLKELAKFDGDVEGKRKSPFN